MRLSRRLVLVVSAAVVFAGCRSDLSVGVGTEKESVGTHRADSKTVTQSIDVGKAESVAVSLEMNAGELKVDGGTDKLMDGTFRFSVPAWEPKIDYTDQGPQGTLRVKQPNASSSLGDNENVWTLHLNDGVPIDFSATLGAGEATITLGTMNLRRVDVRQGAGEMSLDLRGSPKRSYDVNVMGGVGEAHVKVPKNVGIVATAKGGLGDIDVHGLEMQKDGTWINPGHEHDAIVIHVDVKGGIGDIEISAEG